MVLGQSSMPLPGYIRHGAEQYLPRVGTQMLQMIGGGILEMTAPANPQGS